MRTCRRLLDTGLPLIGVVIILGALFLVHDLRAQIAVVILGILMNEAGTWKLAHRLLPNERRFLALRVEVDRFLALVRELNAAAVGMKEQDSAVHRQAFEAVRDEMRQSVERMAEVAGKTDVELVADQKVVR